MHYRTLISPWTDRSGRFSLLKTGIFVLVCIPALLIAIAFWRHALGPLPYKEALHQVGDPSLEIIANAWKLTRLLAEADKGISRNALASGLGG